MEMTSLPAFLLSVALSAILISDFGIHLTTADEEEHQRCNIQYGEDRQISADCSGLNLTSIPTSLPRNITKLDVSRNVIADVVTGTPLRQYDRLKVVDLSSNLLIEIDWRAFPESIQQLDLSHNNLVDVCVNKGKFVDALIISLSTGTASYYLYYTTTMCCILVYVARRYSVWPTSQPFTPLPPVRSTCAVANSAHRHL